MLNDGIIIWDVDQITMTAMLLELSQPGVVTNVLYYNFEVVEVITYLLLTFCSVLEHHYFKNRCLLSPVFFAIFEFSRPFCVFDIVDLSSNKNKTNAASAHSLFLP